jgi:hypothetical protein
MMRSAEVYSALAGRVSVPGMRGVDSGGSGMRVDQARPTCGKEAETRARTWCSCHSHAAGWAADWRSAMSIFTLLQEKLS